MKRKNYTNLMLLLCLWILGVGNVKGQLLTEHFEYGATNGDLVPLSGGNWVEQSPPATPNVGYNSASIIYGAYPALGGKATFGTTGQDIYRQFADVTSGVVYAGFLLKINSAQATGDYFMHFSNNGIFFHGRLFARTKGIGYELGLAKGGAGGGGTAVYNPASTTLTFGTAYYVVLKYNFGTDAANVTDDVADVYVFDTSVPVTEPGTSYVQATAGTGTLNELRRIAIRQGVAANAPAGEIDYIRVGTTWADVTSAPATTVIYEPFAGTGVLQGQNDWATHSGTASQIQRIAGNLTLSGFATPSGNKVAIVAGNSEDVNKDLGSDLTGDIYASALINVSNLTGLTTTGDYFLHLATTAGMTVTNFASRLFIKATATGFNLGIVNHSGGGSTPSYVPTEYATGSTYLVVMKYNTTSNTANLWVNPVIGGAEPAPLLTNNTGTNTATQIRSICIRQAGTGSAGTGNIQIDEIRVGTTWADVTPTGPILSFLTSNPASLTGFSTDVGIPSASQSYVLSGSSLIPATGDVTVTASSNFEVSLDNVTYSATLTIPYTGGTLPNTTIYVRIVANAEVGTLSGNITNTAGSATTQTSVSGIAKPSLRTSVSTLDFGTLPKNEVSEAQVYKLSGGGLPVTGSNNVVINAPNNFQVSKNNTDFSSTVSFTNAEVNNAGTTGLDVYVRFAPTSEVNGEKGGDVTHSVPGIVPTLVANVAVRGVQAPALSIADEYATKVKVYPNPAGRKIQIKSSQIYEVEVQDVSGRKILNFRSNDGADVEGLPNGMYFLQFRNGNIQFVKRLVIQK
jgi:hypothetical protein